MGISLMNIKSCLGTKVVGGRNVHKLNGLFGEEEEAEKKKNQNRKNAFFAKCEKAKKKKGKKKP